MHLIIVKALTTTSFKNFKYAVKEFGDKELWSSNTDKQLIKWSRALEKYKIDEFVINKLEDGQEEEEQKLTVTEKNHESEADDIVAESFQQNPIAENIYTNLLRDLRLSFGQNLILEEDKRHIQPEFQNISAE
ncbi:hypothetical protein INT47_010894 [Mucor saturninus]|uniref:Uncharacterized protein n=1 Tax=Mucor saturninus TaxID=64648 RepID=A0A8H7RCE3_9FUNG|nr:hypothetical protein INT47_010894 [Mucor saturninus]